MLVNRIQNRRQGKSAAFNMRKDWVKENGKFVSTSIKDGLVTDIYDVNGHKWAFVKRVQPDQDRREPK